MPFQACPGPLKNRLSSDGYPSSESYLEHTGAHSREYFSGQSVDLVSGTAGADRTL
jgi:hypothetical protein